jgi:hypothetical protein
MNANIDLIETDIKLFKLIEKQHLKSEIKDLIKIRILRLENIIKGINDI